MEGHIWSGATPAFNPGPKGVPTAFVLAVSGSKELAAGRPAAGATGANLDRILVYLNRHDPGAFPSVKRYDYRVANAVETAMFGDKSMPDLIEVLAPDNLAHLAEQLDGIGIIVALSEPAIEGVRAVGLRPAYRHILHPAMRGVNNRYRGLGRGSRKTQWRVEERCRRYAEEVIASRT